NDDTDQQRTRNRAEGIAPRHTLELGREGLGVLLSRGGKLGSRIRNSACGAADLGGDRLTHAASGFCHLPADLRREPCECILQACHVPAQIAHFCAQTIGRDMFRFNVTGSGTGDLSLSVAFSASLTRTPPMPRNPPPLEASATCWLIWRSQPLKAAASPGALASTTAPACRSVSMHLALISAGLLPVSFSFRPSRAVLRPSAVSKSATTALISASAPGSNLAVISALPSAKLSFPRPPSPLGSAPDTAIAATITLSRRSFHSSGVKFDLSGIGLLLYLSLGLLNAMCPIIYCIMSETRLMAIGLHPLCH